MDRTQYWELIEKARELAAEEFSEERSADLEGEEGEGSPDAQTVVEKFIELLQEHEPECISDAWLRHRELLHEAYSWELWGAAYQLLGGCSDDSFEYFRNWLILQGRETFDAVLADPDSLADVVSDEFVDEEDVSCEELSYAPAEAYEAVTGEEMPEHRDVPEEPELGEEFDFDEEEVMRQRYPRLSEREMG